MFFFGGDFNFYSSSITTEPAHNSILNGGSITLLDPISSPGNWNNNSSFASLHTQSTRSGTIGDGGSFGGMDDRFDFIFFTADLQTGANDLTYVPNSYKAIGNDGNHFNKSINASPTNTAVPANIADALYIMSDHLPVVLKAAIPLNVGVIENGVLSSWNGYFWDDSFKFKSLKNEKELTVSVYDVLGKTLKKKTFKNGHQFELKLQNLRKGLYFVRVVSTRKQESFKFFKR